jgi:hypothetical protein
VDLLGSLNNSKVMRKFDLYINAQYKGLIEVNRGSNGFFLYLLGDKGYPLILWIMTQFKEEEQHTILELFNRKHKKGCFFMENVFNILKTTYREFSIKSKLNISLLCDVFMACCFLHNLL